MKSEKKKLNETLVAPPEAFKFLDGIIGKHFQGKNGELLQTLLNKFSFENPEDLMRKILVAIKKQTGKEDFDIWDIETLDIMAIGRELISNVDIENFSIELTEEEAKSFENSFKEFSHSTLHDIAFPMLVVESPQVAGSVKGLIQRTVDSIQTQENIDLSDVYEELDIENLPTEFSYEMLVELGGSIPGLDLLIPPPPVESDTDIEVATPIENITTMVEDAEVIYEKSVTAAEPIIIFCELTDEQTWFLAYRLWKKGAINSCKKFHSLLKSKGKYESVLVKDKGIILSVIYLLYRKLTISEIRYISTTEKGFWPVFQQYLLDAKTKKPFEYPLHKLREANFNEEEANEIIEEVLSPNNQAKNLETIKKEIFNK